MPNENSAAFTLLLRDHATAVQEFIAVASQVRGEAWDTPRAPDKWSPAQETKHLTLAMQAFVRDLRGEGTLRLRGSWWRRRIWHWTVLPWIIKNRRIPRAVRAPREVRPPDHPGTQVVLLEELRGALQQLESELIHAQQVEPKRRVTHPFFDQMSLEEFLRFAAVHARHHASFVRTALARA